MTASTLRLGAITLGITALLAACGGGEAPLSTAQQAREFVQRIVTEASPAKATLTPSAPPVAPQSATVSITNDMVFAFAQTTFKDLFPVDQAPTVISNLQYEGKTFEVRGYRNGNFLGVSSSNEIWGLGPYTGNVLTSFGPVSGYACQIVPSSCVPVVDPPATAGLNECTDPASSTLPTGFRLNLVFTYTGTVLGGDQTVDSVIDGPGTFESQSAVQITSTTSGTNTVSAGGFSITTTTSTKTRSYAQKGNNGLVKTLGALIDATSSTTTPPIGGVTLPPTSTTISSKTVFTPPDENVEFTLALGQSIDKKTTQTTTVTAGPGGTGPQTTTGTVRHTFEAKESISLANGKTYSACRYKTSNVDGSGATSIWYLVGKGVPLRTQSTVDGKTQTIEMKSGSYNGTPL